MSIMSKFKELQTETRKLEHLISQNPMDWLGKKMMCDFCRQDEDEDLVRQVGEVKVCEACYSHKE